MPKISPERIAFLASSQHALPSDGYPLLAHGKGRSYGDVCLSDQGTLLMTSKLDHFIEFDPASGLLRCESGVMLADILALVTPKGWFLPVTPGTRYVTVGGAVANDVHGKNHQIAGSFGHHVSRLELIRSTGERIQCSRHENDDLFAATIGGLGLTGLISWVELQLIRIDNSWIWMESRRFQCLDQFWELNEIAEQTWPYVVAWIDCLARGANKGRGILLCGRHAPPQPVLPEFRERHRQFPFDPAFSLVNQFSLSIFNRLYYRQPVFPAGQLTHYLSYFYPLDTIQNWNRVYGVKGFYQYQCVLPPDTAREGISDLLDRIASSKEGSFLAVLKSFGTKPSIGLLSFPRPGATLALDFPNRGAATKRLLNSLDEIVREAGGALYPAKDARMPAAMFRAGFPEWQRFCNFIDPAFSSNFWRRVTS